MLGSLITSRILLYENTIVAHLRLFVMIRPGDFVLRCFRVLRTIKGDHSTQH